MTTHQSTQQTNSRNRTPFRMLALGVVIAFSASLLAGCNSGHHTAPPPSVPTPTTTHGGH